MGGARRKRSQPETQITFFLDQGLDRYDVAQAVRTARLTGSQMAERFAVHASRIELLCQKPGPFVDVLHSRTIERRWPSRG